MAGRASFRLTEGRAAAALFALVAVLPALVSFNPYTLSILVAALILGSVALAWNLLAGGCGQVSFGHAGFFGIGAYASAILAMKAGLSPFAAMAAGGAIGGAAALLVGFPAFRLRGPYFAMAILGLAECVKLVCRNLTPLTEGSRGIYNVPPLPALTVGGATIDFHASRGAAYYLAAGLLLLVYLAVRSVKRSTAGLAMTAVRNDEEAAAGIGVPVFRAKMAALCVSAACTALAGAFYAHHVRFLSPDTAFDGAWSLMPIVGSLFGGMSTLIGPAAGALVIAGLDEFLFKRLFDAGHKLFFGLLLAAVIVWMPSGLLGGAVRGGRKGPS